MIIMVVILLQPLLACRWDASVQQGTMKTRILQILVVLATLSLIPALDLLPLRNNYSNYDSRLGCSFGALRTIHNNHEGLFNVSQKCNQVPFEVFLLWVCLLSPIQATADISPPVPKGLQ